MEIKKFDIFMVNLNPQKGSAQSGVRPCVVIQSNVFNKYSSTVIVVPLTTSIKKIFPSEFIIYPSKENGLKDDSRFLGSQLITVDKKFFLKKSGFLEEKYFIELQESIKIALDFDDMFF